MVSLLDTRPKRGDELDRGGKGRSRLYVDVPPDVRRRVHVAAAHEDVTIQEYVVRSLEQSLRQGEASRHASARDEAAHIRDRLLAVRRRVFQGGMLPDDSVDILAAERERETR